MTNIPFGIADKDWVRLQAAFPYGTEILKALKIETLNRPEEWDRCIAAWRDGDIEREPLMRSIIREVSERVEWNEMELTRRQTFTALRGIGMVAGGALLPELVKTFIKSPADTFLGDRLAAFCKEMDVMPVVPATAEIKHQLKELRKQYPQKPPLSDFLPYLFQYLAVGAGVSLKVVGESQVAPSIDRYLNPQPVGHPLAELEGMLQQAEIYRYIRNARDVMDDGAHLLEARWPKGHKFLQILLDQTKNSPHQRKEYIQLLSKRTPFADLPAPLQDMVSESQANYMGSKTKKLLMFGVSLGASTMHLFSRARQESQKAFDDWNNFVGCVTNEINSKPANHDLEKPMKIAMANVTAQLKKNVEILSDRDPWMQSIVVALMGGELVVNCYWLGQSPGDKDPLIVTSDMFEALESNLRLYDKVNTQTATEHRERLLSKLDEKQRSAKTALG